MEELKAVPAKLQGMDAEQKKKCGGGTVVVLVLVGIIFWAW
jgi:hypothetical protein